MHVSVVAVHKNDYEYAAKSLPETGNMIPLIDLRRIISGKCEHAAIPAISLLPVWNKNLDIMITEK